MASPLCLWLGHPPREHRYGFRLLLESGQVAARPCGGPGGPGGGSPATSLAAAPRTFPDSGLAAPASPPGLRPRSPYPQDVVALCAAARDLDALRGAHGGGRSVRPGRLSAAPPRALPAPRLRVALGTWHLQPPEPGRTARREIVARQPRPLRRRRQRPLTGAGGKDPRARRWRRGRNLSRRAGRRKCGSERDAALRGPGVDKTHLGAFLSSRKGTWLQRPLVARGKRERE